mmetsp:Transcript_12931/g.24462  ORF Transcript_12931/g.24462 Transcript_12931/m.24462 type:complete len:232 (+) Transcript_12931:130-825(+)
MQAAVQNHHDIVRCLVEGKANVNVRNPKGMTALIFAARENGLAVVRYLSELSLVNHKDPHGQDALIWAARKGHLGVVKCLVENADFRVNSADNHGNTSLIWASFNNDVAMCRYLCEIGKVSVNQKSSDGRTAVIEAARYNRFKTLRYLVQEAKAECFSDTECLSDGNRRMESKACIMNETSPTAMDYALQNGHSAIVRFLQHELRKKHLPPVLERDLKMVHMLHAEILTAL